jgi:hypothetical protein
MKCGQTVKQIICTRLTVSWVPVLLLLILYIQYIVWHLHVSLFGFRELDAVPLTVRRPGSFPLVASFSSYLVYLDVFQWCYTHFTDVLCALFTSWPVQVNAFHCPLHVMLVFGVHSVYNLLRFPQSILGFIDVHILDGIFLTSMCMYEEMTRWSGLAFQLCADFGFSLL